VTRITPCYHLYPKDPQENLRWRVKCRRRAIDDKRFRYALYDACMLDPLFFMGFACWSLEPRAKQKIRPFIPWPHQESVFVAMDKAIDDSAAEERCIDVLLDKSRAQGGTFGYLWLLLRRWLRDPMFSAGYVTRNEKLVDSPTDTDTLFWKLAWGIERLPYWLKPKGFDMKKHRSLSSHSILNPENGATHVGYAAGQDVGAGGRKSCFVCDEFGAKDFIAGGKDEAVMEALHDVTHCIFLVSARYADAGVFNRACEDPDHSGLHLILDWKDNPIHGKHSYVVGGDGVARARKPDEQDAVDAYHRKHTDLRKRLERRGFKYEGVVRSPWYDMRCVAKGTLVVTDSGLVPIEKITVANRVWDGNMWVTHDGCIFSGWKETIRSYRVGLTSDHLVLTTKGWKHAIYGFDRAEVRLPDGYQTGRQEQVGPNNVVVPVSVWNGKVDSRLSVARREFHKLRLPVSTADVQVPNVQLLGCDDSAVHEPESSQISDIRRAWNHRLREVEDLCELRRGHGGEANKIDSRQDRQRWELRAGELSLGRSSSATEQQAQHDLCRDIEGNSGSGRHCKGSRDDDQGCHRTHQEGLDGGRSFASTQNPEPVYDLLNCGPRRAFTVIDDCGRPLLVHNCLRDTATPRLIASQLDRDPRGAVGKVFATDLLDRVKREHCRPPVWRGTPVFDSESAALVGLLTRDDGPLKLWFRPGPDNSCPLGPFTVGCDIAIGSDGAFASNSVASGIDDRTGEQIMEFAVRGVPSIKFARQVVGLCLWLRNAYLGWEDSGMVAPFAKEILEVLYYGNVYYREVAAIGLKRKTRKAGWWNGRDEHKADLFEKMALAMETNQYTVRSEELVRECGEYEWDDGKIIHQPTKNHGNTEKAHGDRCIAAGVAWLLYLDRQVGSYLDRSEENVETPQYGSFIWREQRELSLASSDSPDFGLRDVLSH